VHGARTYPDASAVCKGWGGDLFSYENHAELSLAQEILGRHTNFWIALRKRRGTWMYSDGEMDGYTLNRWKPGSPKTKDPDLLCGAQVVRSGVNNYIQDTACTTSLPFICKKYQMGKAPTVAPVVAATTVRHMREDWKDPPDCKFLGNKVELYQNSNYGGWKAVLGEGEFRNLDAQVCDNDKKLCEVKPCNARPNSLSSLKIPGGLAVTLYDDKDFKGASMTLYGPKDISDLNAHRRAWSDRAESIRIEIAPASKWLMRTYKSAKTLRHQPFPGLLTAVGEAEVPWVKMTSTSDFQSAVAGTPNSNFAAYWYGNVQIKKAGVYNLCTDSDDGSRLFVDGHMIINDGGLHGRKKVCGDTTLAAGIHLVTVWFFNGGGAAYQNIDYMGPDTGGAHIPVPSISTTGIPAPPPTSLWTMKVFKQISSVASRPATRSMDLVGTSSTVSAIDFDSSADFKVYIKDFPSSNLAVLFYGNPKIQTAGNYNYCLKSADGAYMYLDGNLVISNGGQHGVKEVCHLTLMTAGLHQIKVMYWRGSGTPYVKLSYAGEATGMRICIYICVCVYIHIYIYVDMNIDMDTHI